ncbi:FABP family protein [Marihabitans asiaticum]|uniref:Ferric nitrobindin-like protein n=1 Tax=Marihabitans asiaticum TaxID=415218 RepID=A0A560WH42_9MICO|nr:FABP family protein [Marihabitans asiaticum]TWD16989.1 uncharacterized protein DUF1794 [Marihabitans asiaticum]
MFTLDATLHPDIAPLAWLVGRWEGAGVVGYPGMESRNFGQEVVCSHDGRPFLRWESRTWLLDADGNQVEQFATELGFWRPGGEGEVELLLTHPSGHVELYFGAVDTAKIQMSTDGIIRSPQAVDYSAATRLYGLVQSNLMWVMDMAAHGEPMQSYMSAELKRVEG